MKTITLVELSIVLVGLLCCGLGLLAYFLIG